MRAIRPPVLPAAAREAAFAAALLDPELACPEGVRAWNGSDPLRRFAVYRNNVLSSLIDALGETFAVTQELVGREFFRAMAAVYVRRHPPRSRILAHYGDDFASFIANLAPAAALPYLPDVARLEVARMQACHAADAEPIGEAALARALANPEALAGAYFEWHPSVQVVASSWAVVSLWAAHQTEGEIAPVAVDRAEQAIVLRDGLDVLVLPVDNATSRFVALTGAGTAFGAAAAEAVAVDATFDLSATLSLLLGHRALLALHAGRPTALTVRPFP